VSAPTRQEPAAAGSAEGDRGRWHQRARAGGLPKPDARRA